jgi:hypothetical protein
MIREALGGAPLQMVIPGLVVALAALGLELLLLLVLHLQ